MNVSVDVPFEVSGVMGAVEMDIVDDDNYIYLYGGAISMKIRLLFRPCRGGYY